MKEPRETDKRLEKLELENLVLKLEVSSLEEGMKGLCADIDDMVRQLRKSGIQLKDRLEYSGMIEEGDE